MIAFIIPLTIIFSPMAQSFTHIDATTAKAAAKNIKPTLKSKTKKAKQLVSSSININTASVKELTIGLKGVGKNKAEAIVEYRTKNGSFKAIDDLLKVKGIGKKILRKNKDRISLSK